MKAPILDAAQFDAVLEVTDTMERPAMYRLLVLLMRDLGLRPKELAGLQSTWFRGDELRIPQGHSKGKACRSLPVSAEILAALQAWMGDRTGTVFLNKQGEGFSAAAMSERCIKLFRKVDLDASCYSGRRTLATNMVDRNVPLPVIQRVLGHSKLNTTMEYVSVTPNMVRQAMFG